MIGNIYGKLKVVSKGETLKRNKQWITRWNCECECGNKKLVRACNLKNGSTISCGCYKKGGNHSRTHGATNTTEYNIWKSMKDRCLNPKCKSYNNYGGRGITVCDRWLESFENFLSDMGKKPKGLTIERVDNSKGYSPDNCIWATRKTQVRNTRKTKLTANQVKEIKKRIPFETLKSIAEDYGVSIQNIYAIKHNKSWRDI